YDVVKITYPGPDRCVDIGKLISIKVEMPVAFRHYAQQANRYTRSCIGKVDDTQLYTPQVFGIVHPGTYLHPPHLRLSYIDTRTSLYPFNGIGIIHPGSDL